MQSKVLILDFGSQYTQLIARRVRELGVYSFLLSGTTPLNKIKEFKPSAIIFSGGPASVFEKGAPHPDPEIWNYLKSEKIPLLGICYGMQLIAEKFNGKVRAATKREYGRAKIHVDSAADGLLQSVSASAQESSWNVWMSHGDDIEVLPEGFIATAKTDSGTIAAFENESLKQVAVQFHPEVSHSENGLIFLEKFLFEKGNLKADWAMSSLIESQIAAIKKQVGESDHAICALSGGVDSCVAAKLVHQAIGDRLHCVFVDHGLLRFKEQERVMTLFREELKLPVDCVDASERFLSKLEGVTDPEKKRKIIGTEFIRVFEDEQKKLEKKLGKKPKFLIQGTLYPDVIESSPAPSGDGVKSTHSVTIKSHHNVGGLPKDIDFTLIEPLRDLFKDEVRKLGAELGVPNAFLKRHPFPGPGLAIRILGDITRERITLLQHADEIYLNALREAGLYDQIWQAFACFLPIRSVGVQGDGRTHDHVIALRAVTSSDGMTADFFPFDFGFLSAVSTKICNQVKGVNRVVYDVTSKPPATIEWE